MRCLLTAIVITGCFAGITGCAGVQGSRSEQSTIAQQNEQFTELCPVSRPEAFVMGTLSVGMLIESFGEAVVSLFKPLESIESVLHNTMKTALSGDEANARRQLSSIDRLRESFENIPEKVKKAGMSLMLTPYLFSKSMITAVVGCPGAG